MLTGDQDTGTKNSNSLSLMYKNDPWQFLFQIKRVYDIIPSNSGVSVALIFKNLNFQTHKHLRAREWKGAKNIEIFKVESASVSRYIQIIKYVLPLKG